MDSTPTMPVLLVVDDDELVLESLEATFEDDFQVFKAGSAELAREIVAERRIDVVISDDRLPRETGVDFLAWFAEEQPRAIRILLTGYFSEPGDVVRAIQQGRVWHYMRKPWEAGSMANIIERAMESQRREDALRVAEERYRRLFADIPVGLFEADQQGNLLTWNEAFSAALGGWPAGRASLASRLPDGQWSALVREQHNAGSTSVVELTCFDGRKRSLKMGLVAGEREGALRGAVCETQRSVAAPEQGPVVRELHDQALKATGYRGALMQMRNQLAVLGGNLELLSQEHGEREELREMSVALLQASTITREALRLDGPWAAQGTSSLDHLCQVMLRSMEIISPELELQVSLGLGEAQVAVTESVAHQIVGKLLHNAVLRAERAGRIEVDTRRIGDRAHCLVRDFGPRIPEAMGEQLFEPASARDLGLSLARRMAREHGGDVRLMPIDGPGALFVLELPLAAP